MQKQNNINEQPKDVVEAFTKYLEANGLKKSQERYAILDAARHTKGMFTAADLHKHITQDLNFHVSLATIYSTLEILAECRIVVEHFLSPKSVNFEYAYGRQAFKYMICSKCGKITPINDRNLDRTVSTVKTPRLHFYFYKTYIYGICATCARTEKSKLRKIKDKIRKNETTRKS